MSERWIDGSVGETRVVALRDGVPRTIEIHRWSDAGSRARHGEVFSARVRKADPRRRGVFLDIGLPGDAFVRADGRATIRIGEREEGLSEGRAVTARIVREAVAGKGPVAEIVGPGEGVPRLLSTPQDDALAPAPPAPPEIAEAIDAAIDAALSITVSLKTGGSLTIEPTAALVAVDVDAANRSGASDPEAFALGLNLDAAAETVRQLSLRNLGGLVAIDFVSLRTKRAQDEVVAALTAAARVDPWGVVVAPMSRFGVVELARGQLKTPLAQRLLDADGRKSAETAALEALRAVERAARTARGRVVRARVAPATAAWLAADYIPWRQALSTRVGSNWSIEPSETMSWGCLALELL